MTTLPIAAMQLQNVPGDRPATLRRVRAQVLRTRRDHPYVRLVVLPELLLCAEPPDHGPDPSELAEDLSGPTVTALCALAREAGVWLLPGSIYERTETGVANTAPVIDPTGAVVSTYRKIFPWYPFEATEPGDRFVVCEIEGVQVGIAICFDGSYPETMRQLAWLGAEVVLHPTLTTTRDRTQELVLARANAIVNQLWVVNVNAAAPTALGASLIVDPEGVVRQQAETAEETLVEVLDIGATWRARRYGAANATRPWAALAGHEHPIHLPAYDGHLSAPSWAGSLIMNQEHEPTTGSEGTHRRDE